MKISKLFWSVFVAVILSVRIAAAQQSPDVVWVQVEAHPSLSVAQDRARVYSDNLTDVSGFSLGGNWYGIVLGPYLRDDAERVLQVLRAENRIPQDSYIALTSALGQQFWPVGADVLNSSAVAVPQTTTTETETVVAAPAEPEPADETPAEARRSERDLTADQRKDLQVAMQAAGFYSAAIDGAFGAGTRRSMSDWQAANGYEVTGVLTTLQRQALLDQYNAPLISVGMQMMRDAQAGIELQMPMKAVKFSRYEPPFAHYDAIGDQGIRVLLISQPGDQATLFGLYDIMQTLEIVPLNGPRERQKDSFTLEGRNRQIVSHTEARLDGGNIKGFTLIWPVGDEARRARILSAMQGSFARLDSVLDPGAGQDTEQHVDLVSGLQVRKPRLSRSGFFIDKSGAVVTTSSAVDGCTRITLNHGHEATVIASDDALGVAILRPSTALAPLSVAQFTLAQPRLQSEVAVSGYSYEGVLGAPTLTFGTLADIKGLGGETQINRLALAPMPGDAGGPVIDAAGGVLGMLLPKVQSGQVLPGDVSFAADTTALRTVLDKAGVAPEDHQTASALAPNDLSRLANGMTVLVSCWD